MFKFDKSKPGYNLTEAAQKNPLRWEMLWKNEEGVLVPQAQKMRCKDYFNDVVSAYNGGPKEPIYGFNVSKILLNEEGQYVRLFEVEDSFYENMMNAVLPEVAKELGVEVGLWKLEKNQGLIFLPRLLFNNTYYISWTTQLIRLCNYHQFPEIKSMENLRAVMLEIEGRHDGKNWGFNIPGKYQDYWWYFSYNANSKYMPGDGSLYMSSIHNNGWQNFAYLG